ADRNTLVGGRGGLGGWGRRLGGGSGERDQGPQLVSATRAGGEGAFLALGQRPHRAVGRFAGGLVPAGGGGEGGEEAWIGVLKGLDKFEGRSSLKAWIFRILVNCAQFRGSREARTVPFSALETDRGESSLAKGRFFDGAHPRSPGHWVKYPEPWSDE